MLTWSNRLFRTPTVSLVTISEQAIGAEGLGFDSRASQIGTVSPTARHRCDVFSELSSPGAKSRKWAPPFVACFGVIARAQ